MRYHGTDIDGPGLDPEQLNVRGRDLNDLVGRVSYPAAQFFFVTGRDLEGEQEAACDDMLRRSLSCLQPGSPALQTVARVAVTGANASRATIAGLMVDASQAIDSVLRDDEVEALGLQDQAAEGLVYVGFLPAMLAYAVETGGGSGTARLDDLLADPPAGDRYIDLVFLLCAGRRPAGTAEARLFEAIMVAFIGGFGYLTPTVMLPRMSAGTRAALPVTLAAGFAGAGPAHTGACELAMQHQAQVQALIAESSAPPLETARQQVRGMLEAEQRVPGFGHPLFRADPRIPRLREVIDEIGFTGEEIDTFELVARAMREEAGLHPNIDGIASAVFRAMGLNAAYGTGLFMCSRAGDMLAHVLEKLRQPPFGISSSAARKYLDSIPTGWI